MCMYTCQYVGILGSHACELHKSVPFISSDCVCVLMCWPLVVRCCLSPCVCSETHVCTGMLHVHRALLSSISSPCVHVHGDVRVREAHNEYDPGGYLEGVGGMWACVCMACRLGRREGGGPGAGGGRVLAARQDRSWSRSLPSFLLQQHFPFPLLRRSGGRSEGLQHLRFLTSHPIAPESMR